MNLFILTGLTPHAVFFHLKITSKVLINVINKWINTSRVAFLKKPRLKYFVSQMRILNLVKHLRWSYFPKIVNSRVLFLQKSSIVYIWLGLKYATLGSRYKLEKDVFRLLLFVDSLFYLSTSFLITDLNKNIYIVEAVTF